MSEKMGVLGDRDSVMAFKAAGLDVFPVDGAEAAGRTLHKMAKAYKVIFVTEQIAAGIPEAIGRYKAQPYPAVILIPSSKGSTGLGMQNVRRNVEKAVGADILFND
jgi:V/A-type H+-transporting ATPase subunit F